MKKAVTFRFDEDLLVEVRRHAERDNRSVTNFIETLLKAHVGARQLDGAEHREQDLRDQSLSDNLVSFVPSGSSHAV